MGQQKFRNVEMDVQGEILDDFKRRISSIYNRLNEHIVNKIILSELLQRNKVLERKDIQLNKAPEDFTEETIIKPLFEFLGYPNDRIHRRTGSIGTVERKEADYTMIVGKENILIEAEPLNKDLTIKGSGINQVESWLEKRSFKADYGVATNGFVWILLKYDSEEYKIKELERIDLTPFFTRLLTGQRHLSDIDEILRRFYNAFSYSTILETARLRNQLMEESKQKITRRFYDDYIKYVFGIVRGKEKQSYCLLNSIRTPISASEHDKRLFSVNMMSRLIFIKFLEDKGLVPSNLLTRLYKEYSESSLPLSFYKSYLQTLFYDVFNEPLKRRKSHVLKIEHFHGISYLNGGLFREVVKSEKEFDVEDDILKKLIFDVLEKYSFTLNGEFDAFNPDILGNVFEKTINYLTGIDENTKKDVGAYYTPDDITSFISKNTIHKHILDTIRESLKKQGWRTPDIEAYESMSDFLDNLPSNPKILRVILNDIENIRILDPACGSGHFLTSSLKEIMFVKRRIIEEMNEKIDFYALKKHIIMNNLFGVDIEVSAIEIAKLRLWLSLIEDLNLDDPEYMDTLPNIEYRIVCGNSLIGWVDEKISQNLNIDVYSIVRGLFSGLKVAYTEDAEKYKLLEESESLIGSKRGNIVTNLKHAYSKLRILYSDEKGEKAILLRDIIIQIRNAIYDFVTPAFENYLMVNHSSKRKDSKSIEKYKVPNQFHWNIDFGDVLENGGFDIIVENPPYGNLLTSNEKNCLYWTQTYNTSEIAANFIERSLKLLKKDGYLGMVVTNSVAINSGTSPVRSVIRKNMSASRMALFGTRPSKLFSDAEIRVLILTGKKDMPKSEGTILTTEAIKFTSEERENIFNNLSFEDTKDLTLGKEKIGDNLEDTSLPKVGNSMIRNILLKLKSSSETTIGDRINKKDFTNCLEFRKTGGYWLTALDKMPYRSSKIEKIYFETVIEKDFSLLVINSSLFYLYWSTFGNLRDLPLSLLKKFPMPKKILLNKYQKRILAFKKELMKCLESSFDKNRGRMGEFKPMLCKQGIDLVDDLLGDIYNLTKKETDFVKKYDSHIRPNRTPRIFKK